MIVEALAIFAFAILGLLEAARKRLDAAGVCRVTGLTAFGGGTLRDVLLDRRPFFWVEHATWLWALLLLCIAAMFFLRTRHFEPTERAMQWPDAVGLGLVTAGGTQVTLTQGMPAIVSVMMGMVTAVFGGVLRDIVCNEIQAPFATIGRMPFVRSLMAGFWLVFWRCMRQRGSDCSVPRSSRLACVHWHWRLGLVCRGGRLMVRPAPKDLMIKVRAARG